MQICITFSMCRKNGLSYFNPQLKHWNLRYMPIEVQAKENAHYLLYVISSESRAAASMVEVSIPSSTKQPIKARSYYAAIALHCRTAFSCIEMQFYCIAVLHES